MAHLTPAQNVTLKAFMAADPIMGALPVTNQGASDIEVLLKAPAVPDFWVWSTGVPVDLIFDAITWSNLTPQDASPVAAIPSAPTAAETYALALYQSRALICQSKQLALQILVQKGDYGSVNAAKSKIRDGIQDALVSIPSGTNGTDKAGGWSSVQLVLQRLANVLEKLFAVGVGSPASPATMAFEGTIDYSHIHSLRLL